MLIHEFYHCNNFNLIEIPKGSKAPTHRKKWHESKQTAADVQSIIDDSDRFNKVGWILGCDHLVIDIDTHDDDKNGWQSLEQLERDLDLPGLIHSAAAVVDSPSGGSHLYFAKPADVEIRKTLPKYLGIDFITGPGKQVIIAGSEHDAHPGQHYAITVRGELQQVDSRLLDLLSSKKKTKPIVFDQPEKPRSGDEFNTSTAGLQMLISEMEHRGYLFRKVRDYWEWTRPGKTSGNNFSGHLGKLSKEGNHQLYCFSTADPYFPPCQSISVFHAYAMLAHGGNHTAAAAALHDRGMGSEQFDTEVDLSFFLGTARDTDRDDDCDDEAFCCGMVPQDGLLRDLFDAYWKSSYRRCSVLGLVSSIAIVQTAVGRKVQSWTGLAPNDYHLVLAPTTSGKEGPLTFANKLFSAAGSAQYLMPEKMQSGNGLLGALSKQPSAVWFADEFGHVLASILDKRGKNPQARAVAELLLMLYGKSGSRFNGSAYAAGRAHEIEAPHLSIVGVSTGHTVFAEITEDQVMDGMLGRIAFWRVHERPGKNRDINPDIPQELADRLARWLRWTPGSGNLADITAAGIPPATMRLEPTAEARARWEGHEQAIDDRMESERSIRSSLWGRVAARSMKLAIVHRLARCREPGAINEFQTPEIEIEDINWGIKLSNWAANLACDLVRETVTDTIGNKMMVEVRKNVAAFGGSATMTQIASRMKRADASQIRAAIKELEAVGHVTVRTESAGRGRPKTVVELTFQTD